MSKNKHVVLPGQDYFLYNEDMVAGDGEDLYDKQVGRNDTFYGEDGQETGYVAVGDVSGGLHDQARGGNDVFYGGEDVGPLVGGVGGIPDLTGIFDPVPAGRSILFGIPGVVFAGDATYMENASVGGKDELYGGQGSLNTLVGDAFDTMFDRSRGGADTIMGGNSYAAPGEDADSVNLLLGDAYSFGGQVRAFDGALDAVAGGADYMVGGYANSLYGASASLNIMTGDAYDMYGISTGGNDDMYGGGANAVESNEDGYGSLVINAMLGDAILMGEGTAGGADWMAGGDASGEDGFSQVFNILLGDAGAMYSSASAGDDTLWGGSVGEDSTGTMAVGNLIIGDTMYVDGPIDFGNDELHGGSGMVGIDLNSMVLNAMFGDAGTLDLDFLGMYSGKGSDLIGSINRVDARDDGVPVEYGNDTIIGGDWADNLMIGDAPVISDGSTGGNDRLYAGAGEDGSNVLVGDAFEIEAGGRGGNDMLVSGPEADQMFGDAQYVMEGRGGADRFVFAPGNGFDTIWDFHVSERDRIDLRAFKDYDDFGSFRELMNSGRVTEEDGTVYIDLDISSPVSRDKSEDVIRLAGVTIDELEGRSFMFG